MPANPIARLRAPKEPKTAPTQPRNNDGTAYPPFPYMNGGSPIGLLLILTKAY